MIMIIMIIMILMSLSGSQTVVRGSPQAVLEIKAMQKLY
jgi:hypothetical protein